MVYSIFSGGLTTLPLRNRSCAIDHQDEYTEYFIAMMKHQAFYSFPNSSFQINVSSPSHFCVYTTLFLIFVLFTIRVTLFFFHIHVLCTKKKQDAKKF